MKQAAVEGMKKELETMATSETGGEANPGASAARRHARGGETGQCCSNRRRRSSRRGKAKQPTEFGKMIKVQEAESQIITSYEVFAKRPSDSELLVPAVEVRL